MNKEEYLNKIFLEVLNKLKLKLNELNELKKLKLEVLKKLKESKSELKKLNELKSELNALNELIIKTPITYNGKTYDFKSQDGIIVYGDIYDDKLIKINYSYDLAIKSPVTIDNENLYLDIYNDIKTAIDEEKILQDMDEESLNLQDMDIESFYLRYKTLSEVDIAGELISKITETDDYKHFRILKALKNLFKVAQILITLDVKTNKDMVGGDIVYISYKGNRYMFPNTSLSVKYNSSIDKLKTTIAYLNSGQTLEIKNAITIINIFSNLADASPYYYSYSSPGSSSDKSFLYEDVLKIVKAKAAERAAEEAAAAAAAEEEAAAAAAAAEEEAAAAAAAAEEAEEEAARAAAEEEAARARARAEAARARAEAARAAEEEAARAAEEEGGKGGGKRKSKDKSKKVSKKPIVSQKKQSIYKEIFGKQMKIYKMPDSRKEYVKYKGELLHISDYKDLMKQKAIAKTKTKATKETKATQQKAIEKTKTKTKETKATQQKAIEKTKTKTKETKATQQKAKAIAKSKAKK